MSDQYYTHFSALKVGTKDSPADGVAIEIDTQPDGTDFDVTIKTGAGQVQIGGDTFWTGDGGIIFGSMYIPGVDIIVSIANANPTEIAASGDGWSAGELNLVTFPTGGDEHYLAVTKAGKYKVDWSISGHTGAGGATGVHGGIMINGVAQRNNGEAHRDVSNSNDDGNIASRSIIDCPNGTEQISLWISIDNSNDFHAEHGTMTITQVGGT